MKTLVASLLIAGSLVTANSAAFAQQPQHPAMAKKMDMSGMCDAMMKEMMADPAIRKKMNAIMQKHMSGMMAHGMSGGAMGGGHASGESMQGMPHPQPSVTTTP